MNQFDNTKISRRKLIQLPPAVFLIQSLPIVHAETCTNNHHDSASAANPYTAQFFTPEELKLLDAVMDKIIPPDEHSPGAHEAQTSLFADLIVTESPKDVKEDWREGLRLLTAELQSSTVDEWLAKAATNERDPRSLLDLFFIQLKQMTVDGYYTSRIGIHQDLEYVGNTYVTQFKGCSHAEHQG